MSTISIRYAETSDIPRLIELMSLFYSESAYAVDINKACYSFSEILNNQDLGFVVVSTDLGIIVGYSVVKRYFAMGNYGYVLSIDDLFIKTEFRGNGIGSKLIEFVIKHGEQEGIKCFSVDVGKSNQKALNLYSKFGFHEQNSEIIIMEREET